MLSFAFTHYCMTHIHLVIIERPLVIEICMDGQSHNISYLCSVSRAATLACSASWSSCCSSKSLRNFRRTPSKRSTSNSLSSTWRFKAFTRRESWGRRVRGLEGNRGGQERHWGFNRYVGLWGSGYIEKKAGRRMTGEGKSGSGLMIEWGWVRRVTSEIRVFIKEAKLSLTCVLAENVVLAIRLIPLMSWVSSA